MIVGPKNSGLEEVGQGALISLVNVTFDLLNVRITDYPMFLAVMQVLLKMVDTAGDAFVEATDRLQEQEAEYQAAVDRGELHVRLMQLRRYGHRWECKCQHYSSRLRLRCGKLIERIR